MSEVKPRFDEGGSLFGLMHRLLPPFCTMGDIDQFNADINLTVRFDKQDQTFMEYRTNFEARDCKFLAIIEYKHTVTEWVKDSIVNIGSKIGSALWAQLQMAKQLRCRHIIVIATNGNQPLYFYEIDTETGCYKHIYTLKWEAEDERMQMRKCWESIGLLKTYKEIKNPP